jgi:putative membrane protein
VVACSFQRLRGHLDTCHPPLASISRPTACVVHLPSSAKHAPPRDGATEGRMLDFIVRTAITAAALWAAVVLVPQIDFPVGGEWWKLAAVAVVFGLINSLVKPVVKLLALPVRLMTMGLVSFLINGAMLLLLAYVSKQLGLRFSIGGFPPTIDADALIGAVLGAIVVSVVSTLLGVLNLGRRIVT